MSAKIQVLQTLRFKGRVSTSDLAEVVGIDAADLTPVIEELVAAGFAVDANGRLKLTKPGRSALAELVDTQRLELDQAALTTAYTEFDEHNSAFKQLVTDWQLKDADTPNDHTDAAYDAAIIDRLAALHATFLPFIEQLAGLVPWLTEYPRRFTEALAKVQAGDHSLIAKPLADSYHTVWFELHEGLIGATGRSRVEEAAAGRAS